MQVVSAYGDLGRRGGREDSKAENSFSFNAGVDIDMECLLLSLPDLAMPSKFLFITLLSTPLILCCVGGYKVGFVVEADAVAGTE